MSVTPTYPPGKDGGWAPKRDDCADHRAPDLFRLSDRVRDGIVVDTDGRPLSTPEGLLHLYAINLELECWVALEHNPDRTAPDAVKHDTILQGAAVLGAGEMIYSQGRLVYLNNLSGTYQVDDEWMTFIRGLIASYGVEPPRSSN